MNIFLESFLLFVIPLFPSFLLIHSPTNKLKQYLDYPLVFSGSFLLTMTLSHILPPIFKNYSTYTTLMFVVGYYTQSVLESFSHGVEHGHVHHCTSVKKTKLGWPILLSLILHSALDSIILVTARHSGHAHHTLLSGILIHKVPASLALSAILQGIPLSRMKVKLYLLLFCLATPITLLLSNQMLQIFSSHDSIINALWALSAGSLFQISTTIINESNPCHQSNSYKYLIVLLLGFIAGITLNHQH